MFLIFIHSISNLINIFHPAFLFSIYCIILYCFIEVGYNYRKLVTPIWRVHFSTFEQICTPMQPPPVSRWYILSWQMFSFTLYQATLSPSSHGPIKLICFCSLWNSFSCSGMSYRVNWISQYLLFCSAKYTSGEFMGLHVLVVCFFSLLNNYPSPHF